MMKKTNFFIWLLSLWLVGLLCLSASLAQAEGRTIKPLKEWRGRMARFLVAPEPARGYLASQAELAKLWQEWQIPGECPQVDFKTNLVLVRTCNCSIITIAPRLNDQGDLQILATNTKDLRDDTAYVLALIPRQGIHTVAGQPLKD